MPVHDIDMDPVRAGREHGLDLGAEPREIGGQDGGARMVSLMSVDTRVEERPRDTALSRNQVPIRGSAAHRGCRPPESGQWRGAGPTAAPAIGTPRSVGGLRARGGPMLGSPFTLILGVDDER
jgi:hypothetical protein